MSPDTPQVLMGALAEQCRHHQQLLWQSTLSFAAAWSEQGALQPVAAFWHCKYDETPLRLRLRFEQSQDPTTGKVFAVESQWALLFAKPELPSNHPQKFTFLRGSFSPALRACDAGTAEGVCTVLQSCPGPGPSGSFLDKFPLKLRLPETDALGANVKGERLLRSLTPWNEWKSCHFTCAAHRVHSSATKSWTLEHNEPIVKGCIHLGLFLNSPGSLAQFRNVLRGLVRDTLVVERGPPQESEASKAFRWNCMQTYRPASARGRSLLVLLAKTLLNSDWRQPTLKHHCAHCCESREETISKVQFALDALISSARPQLFSKANWRHWWKGMPFVGLFASMHQLLNRVVSIQLASGTGVPHLEEGGGIAAEDLVDLPLQQEVREQGLRDAVAVQPADPDAMLNHIGVEAGGAGHLRGMQVEAPDLVEERVRLLASQRRQQTKDFLASPLVHDRCYILFQSLVPECRLMDVALASVGKQWEQEQMADLIRTGHRCHQLNLFYDHSHSRSIFHSMLVDCSARLQDESLWSHVTPSQLLANEMATTVLRSASVVHQTLVLPSRVYPLKLIQLPNAPPDLAREIVEELGGIAPCRLDAFTSSFLTAYPDPQAPEALATLHGMLTLLDGSTYSTEVLHSKNLRFAKGRIQTHLPDLQALAVPHQMFTGPLWTKSVLEPSRKKRHNDAGDGEGGRKQQRRSRKLLQEDRGQQPPHLAAPQNQAGPAGSAKRVARPGGGGAWRAFLHVRGRSFKGGAVTDMATTYRSLGEEDRAYFQQLGRQASASHRLGAAPFAAAAEARRKASRSSAKPPSAALQHFDKELAKLSPEGDGGGEIPAPAHYLASGAVQEARNHFNTQGHGSSKHRWSEFPMIASVELPDSAVTGTDLQSFKNTWKAFGRALSKRTRKASQASTVAAEVLARYHADQGPDARQHQVQISGVRHVSYPSFCPSTVSVVTAEKVPLVSSNSQLLHDRWEQLHKGVRAGTCLATEARRPPPSKACIHVGRCVCSGEARWLSRLHTGCMKAMKELFPAASQGRARLANGEVVLQWLGSKPPGDDVGRDQPHGEGGEHRQAGEAEEGKTIYVHVSLMYLNPWRPTFTKLSRVGVDEFAVVFTEDGLPSLMSSWELVFLMDLQLQWVARPYLVHCASRDFDLPLRRFGHLTVSGGDQEEVVAWQGKIVEEQLVQRRPRRDGQAWADLLEPQGAHDENFNPQDAEVDQEEGFYEEERGIYEEEDVNHDVAGEQEDVASTSSSSSSSSSSASSQRSLQHFIDPSHLHKHVASECGSKQQSGQPKQ